MENRSKKINPDLNVGDRIILLKTMDDIDPIFASERGVVKGISNIGMDMKNIEVEWDNGRRLAIIPEVDVWMLETEFGQTKKLNEDRDNNFYSFTDDFNYFQKYFKFLVIKRFLDKLKDSGIVNMFGASPYLYMGKNRIESIHQYDEIAQKNEEEYQEMLSMSDKCQSELVRGTVKMLEDEGVDADIDRINRALQKNANKLLLIYMKLFSL